MITKDFLEQEIAELESEAEKARIFQLQTQSVIAAYRMLIGRLEQPETEGQG